LGVKIISKEEAANLIQDGQMIANGGFVGCNVAETLLRGLEERFLKTGSPKNLSLIHAAGQGDGIDRGVNRMGYEGLLKRIIGGHFNMAPKVGKLVVTNKIEAYNFPQGVITHMFRDIASKRIGTITHVGLNTFVDPRVEGGKLNARTTEDLVEIININNQERLFYKPHKLDVAFIRGTYADEKGNVAMSHEAVTGETLSIAQAVRNCGGTVFVQVDKIVQAGSLDPRLVKIPGICVDYLVLAETEEDKEVYFTSPYDPSLCGDAKVPVSSLAPLSLNERKIIGRRAAMELTASTVVNLGIGMPESVSSVASEEGIGDYMTLTVEAGPIGGIPVGGKGFGASVNPECIIDQAYQFDFYDGGGIDLAFLGLAQADEKGNINVSKFGTRLAGCGGFVNITQNAKRVFFLGTFTAKGLKIKAENGTLTILNEGSEKKFLKHVEQITFSGEYAVKNKLPVMYITERAVFELREDGLCLTEIAPGIDLQKDVLNLMDFKPKIAEPLKKMDARLFMESLVGLKK